MLPVMDTAIADFIAALRSQVAGDLRTDLYSRTLYSTDASLYQVMPHGVLIPRHVDDLQAAVATAARYNVALLPRAGGSSLAGQAVNAALVMDTSRHLDALLELNVEEQWVRVQPGIVLDTLNAAVRPHGLQFGPDPASSNRACLGGIVSNNATGSHSILYGMAVDHVLEMKVVLSDGSTATFGPREAEQVAWLSRQTSREGAIYREIAGRLADPANVAAIRCGTPRHWRRCGGYNLARFVHDGSIDHYLPQDPRFNLVNLVCGAEGTLATITELKLKLVPRPSRTALAIVEFAALQTALEATPAILATGPSAVELIDDLSLRMACANPEYDRLQRTFLQGRPFCFLAVEYYGATEKELEAKVNHLITQLPRRASTGPITPLYDTQRQANVWNLRKVGLGLLMSVRSDWKPIPFIEDTAVPPEHLADYIPKIEAFCRSLGAEMTYYAHASAGCLHIRPMINTKLGAEIDKMKAISGFVAELLGAYGGALSSEHGDGRVRSWLNEAFYGSALYGLFRTVKRTFDPQNLFNPGNIVDAPPIERDLRQGPGYATIALTTHLHFDQGLAHEVEMCNGAGVCRKLSTGAMCPSFMATREEEQSTRGRANLLRAALSGRIPAGELTSPRMYDVMALCVSCKACKAECPSSVDMARLKTEFLAHYYTQNPRPLRDQLFAHIDLLSRLSSGWRAPLINWALALGATRAAMAKLLQIGTERPLPAFARHPMRSWNETGAHWADRERLARRHTTRPALMLFVDTYNAYSYPQIARAAAELLTAAGWRVVLSRATDAGRPALSKGMVELARRRADALLNELEPPARMGTPIVFLEPSDWSAVVDDYAALLPGDRRVAAVARQSFPFEAFILHLAERGELGLAFTAAPRSLLFHGHCHQKALQGTKVSLAVLGMPPGYRVREIDSSCCGMAGSFGFEAEHDAVSRTMAEHRLAPEIRAAGQETIIVAAGASCRQQIAHLTGRQARHPAEVLWEAVREA